MPPRLIPQGDWRPGGFPPHVSLSVTLVLLIAMGVRGADYAWGDSAKTAHRLSEIEAAMPLWVWGVLFLGSAVIGFASILLRFAEGLIWAHVIGWAIYWAVAVGILIDVYHREPQASFFNAWVTVVLIVGALTVACSVRHAEWPLTSLVAVAIIACTALCVAASDWDGLRNSSVLAGIGMLHAVMAYGTASVTKQNRIRDKGETHGVS